jgi:hypothetical protein
MKEKLQNEYVEKMQECVNAYDPEAAHGDADKLLCELLEKLGYAEVVAKYKEVARWYA